MKDMGNNIASVFIGITAPLAYISPDKIIEAAIIAFVGGVCGYIGKKAIEIIIKKVFKKKTTSSTPS